MALYAIPHFGKTSLCQVARRDVELYLDRIVHLSAKRKNNIMVPLKCLFNDARRRGDVKDTPCEFIRRFKEDRPFIDPLRIPEQTDH